MRPPLSASANFRLLGHSDQGGRPDGVQAMLHEAGGRRHLYVGHMFADGITVLNVGDPRDPAPIAFLPCPPNTRAHHIQVADGLLLATNSANIWAMQRYQSQDAYFTAPLADSFDRRERGFTAGLRVFTLEDPATPREIGFCPVGGVGLHRIWWIGGRYAYASCHIDGYTDHVLATFDLQDPARPQLVNTWALPGMNRGAGEAPTWPRGKRWALHHMITAGRTGYAAWRDGGFTVHDLADPAAPGLLAHRLLSPPFAGGSHTPLPLPGRGLALLADEAVSSNCERGLAQTWVIDVRAPENPVPFATLPQPGEADYCAAGGKFGPHNLHENRPGLFQSETLVFATWHNAGLRAFDLSDPFHPNDIGHLVPAGPERVVDIRPGAVSVTQSCDVLVDRNGIVFVTDTNAGLSVLQFEGGA